MASSFQIIVNDDGAVVVVAGTQLKVWRPFAPESDWQRRGNRWELSVVLPSDEDFNWEKIEPELDRAPARTWMEWLRRNHLNTETLDAPNTRTFANVTEALAELGDVLERVGRPGEKFLFSSESKVPVMHSAEEARRFIDEHYDRSFCLYLAEKNEAGWDRSTSRVYMNELWPELVYLPVNVPAGDLDELGRVYDLAVADEDQIVAVNHTAPHKSNPVLRDRFTLADHADVLIRPFGDWEIVALDLNGPSFFGWLDQMYPPADRQKAVVVIVGVGGVGTPLARVFARQGCGALLLVEPRDISELKTELGSHVAVDWYRTLEEMPVEWPHRPFLVVNCSGKEGSGIPGIEQLFAGRRDFGDFFCDLRPQLELDTVRAAQAAGWQAYTGEPFNAANDFHLACQIAAAIGRPAPDFVAFRKRVRAASQPRGTARASLSLNRVRCKT